MLDFSVLTPYELKTDRPTSVLEEYAAFIFRLNHDLRESLKFIPLEFVYISELLNGEVEDILRTKNICIWHSLFDEVNNLCNFGFLLRAASNVWYRRFGSCHFQGGTRIK